MGFLFFPIPLKCTPSAKSRNEKVRSKLGDGVLPAFKTLASHVLKAQEEREEEREGLWLNAGTTVALGEARKAKKKGCC